MLWVLLWPYHPLPCLHCTCSLLSYWVTCRYLTFLAVDWLRTVSASPFPGTVWLVGSCSLPPQTPLLWFSPFLAVSLCLTLSPPFVLPSLLLFYCCFALRSLCLLAIGLPCFVCSVSVIYLALLCLSSCLVLLWSWVWCLVFLAVDWSRISSAVPLQFV